MILNLKHLLVMMFVLLSVNLMAQTSISPTGVEYSRNGNTFSSVTKSKQQPELTPYTWKDSKGNEYPIYISASGSCFIIKENGNKQYMKKEISMQICSELGREYKNKKK